MSESNEKEQMPGLRYHDQTPVAKADNKRLRSAFSPTDDNDNNAELKKYNSRSRCISDPGYCENNRRAVNTKHPISDR